MKVIQVLNHFLPQQTAGTEVYTFALSEKLQQLGIIVKVVVPHYGKPNDNEYNYQGIHVHQYAEPTVVDRSLIIGHRTPDGLSNFISYLESEKPEIVHFHEIAGSNGITIKHIRCAKTYGAKVIMTLHLAGYSCKTGTLMHKGKNFCNGIVDLEKCSSCYLHARGYVNVAPILVISSKILHQLAIDTIKWNNKLGTALGTVGVIAKLKSDLLELVNACDRVVTIANWYQQVLLSNGIDEKKIYFIPQGLPLSSANNHIEKKSCKQPLRLLFLGRINKFKGLHLLLEALMSFPIQAVELSIYGNSEADSYEPELRKKSAQMANIKWLGKLEQSEVQSTMSNHDVLCLCSTLCEMSPLVIQEAKEAAIPVLASNVYGNAEQINHGKDGLLFDFNSVESLKEQITRLIEEPELICHLKANIKKPRKFEEIGNDYLSLYKRVLSE